MLRKTTYAALALLLAGCPAPPATDAGDAALVDATDITLVDVPDAPLATDAPDATATPPWLEPYTPAPRARFPANFLWGSATSPYQIEGGLGNTDWAQWEQMGRVAGGDRADDGPHSRELYLQDLAVLTETHQNAYRFGIEWARLFPTPAAWAACRSAAPAERVTACRAAAAPAELQYYHELLAALQAAHITPMVTLQHFSLPTYINNLTLDWQTQGWMRAGIVDDLAAYAGFVAAEYGGQVDWWVTINEPTAAALTGYIAGIHPPGRQLDGAAMPTVHTTMIRAHVAMYDAVHAADTVFAVSTGPFMPARAAMVSIAHNAPRYYPANVADPRDVAAARRADQVFNHVFLDAIVRGDLDQDLDGTLGATEPHADPALRGRADYLGVNYYSSQILRANPIVPVLRAIPMLPGEPHGLPMSELGLDIHPRGMQDTLTWAGAYGLPVVVTENGLSDGADANRPRFLAEHLAAVAAAIQAGVPVIGYFHWATIDNLEWSSGYCPHFGLYRVDFASANRARTARPSAAIYRAIIDAREVSDAVLAAQPAYQTPATFCTFNLTLDAGL